MARAWATLAEPCQFAQNRDIRHGGVGGHDESTSHVCVRTPFELEWTDSEMAEGSWRWDQMHNPTPLSPLSIEMSDLVLESLVSRVGNTVEISGEVVEDLAGGLMPDEGARVFVPVVNPAFDGAGQVGHAAVGAAP